MKIRAWILVSAASLASISSGWSFDWATEPTQQEVLQTLKDIDSLTSTIKDETVKNRQNTDMIRSILVEKQKMTLALNRISLLQQNGAVLTKVAPTSQIISEVNQMVSNPQSSPTPITLGQMPILSTPGQAVSQVKSLITSAQDTVSQAQGIIGQVGSLASGGGGGGAWGVLDLASKGAGVLDSAGNLVSSVSGIYSAINQMVYTGKTFIGTDWGNIDSVKSLLGGTIALDRESPFVEIPVVGKLSSALYDARTGYQSAQSAYDKAMSTAQQAKNLISQNTGTSNSTFLAGSEAARRADAYALADGVHLRPESELDAAYFHMVQNGTEAQRMAFVASTTMSNGSCYDPVVGWFNDGEKKQPVNLNDVLSGGAYVAVENFRTATASKDPNAYDRFAASVAPLSEEILSSAQAGKKIEVSAELVAAAAKAPPINLKKYPTLASMADPHADRLFADILDARPGNHSPYQPISNSSTNSGIVVMGLPAADLSEYNQRITASDARVSQNNRMLNICVATINYTQKALEATTRLRSAIQGLAGLSSSSNALEIIPPMIQNCDNTILFLQRQVSDYSLEVERLQKERNTELSGRADFVRKTREHLTMTARSRMSSVLLNSQAIPASAPAVNQGTSDKPPSGAAAQSATMDNLGIGADTTGKQNVDTPPTPP